MPTHILPSTSLFSGKITATSDGYVELSSATGVFKTTTGIHTFGGDITVADTKTFIMSNNSTGTAQTVAMTLGNTTAATSGNQKYSPMIVFQGDGYGTTAGTSQAVQWALQNRPVQSTIADTDLVFWRQVNGGGYSERLKINGSSGTIITAASTFCIREGVNNNGYNLDNSLGGGSLQVGASNSWLWTNTAFKSASDNSRTFGAAGARASSTYTVGINSETSTMAFTANVADGSSAIAYIFDNTTSLVNAAAKLVSMRNGTAEKWYLDKSAFLVTPDQATAETIALGWGITTGKGGATAGVKDGYAGGPMNITLGAGGTGSASKNPGIGGTFTLRAGDGGALGGGTSGNAGGDVFFDAGNATGTASNGSIKIGTQAGGNVIIGRAASVNLNITGVQTTNTAKMLINPSGVAGGSHTALKITGATGTTNDQAVEAPDLWLSGARSVAFGSGAPLTNQRQVLIESATYTFNSSQTITNAATLALTGSATAGTNATITNNYNLWAQSGINRIDSQLGVNIKPASVAFQVSGPSKFKGITTPVFASLVPQGTTGATTYSYQLISTDIYGNKTAPSTLATITNGNATLNGTNFNRLTWVQQTGEISYDIVRYTGGVSQGSIALSFVGTTLDDTGLGASVYATPDHNATGDITLDDSSIIPANAAQILGSPAHNFFQVYSARIGISSNQWIGLDGTGWFFNFGGNGIAYLNSSGFTHGGLAGTLGSSSVRWGSNPNINSGVGLWSSHADIAGYDGYLATPPPVLKVAPGAFLTVSGEANQIWFKTDSTYMWATGSALTTQRFTRFDAPTMDGYTAGCTSANTATVAIAGAPIAAVSGKMTISNPMSFWVQSGLSKFDGYVKQKVHAAFSGSDKAETTAAIQTTTVTQTALWSFTLADNTLYWFEAYVIGRDTAGADRAFYIRQTRAHRQSAGSATLGSVQTPTTDESNAAWDCTFTVSGNIISVSVTGAAATTINWTATIKYQAVSGNT